MTYQELIELAFSYVQLDKPLPVDLSIKIHELGIGALFDEDKQED